MLTLQREQSRPQQKPNKNLSQKNNKANSNKL